MSVAFAVERPPGGRAASLRQATGGLKPLVASRPGQLVVPATPRQGAWDGIAAFCEMLAGLVPSAELAALVGHLERIARGMTTLGDDA